MEHKYIEDRGHRLVAPQEDFLDLQRKQHLFKLADAFFDNLEIDNCEYGGIGLNSKRPFGNSYVEGDILEIIGLEPDAFDDDRYPIASKQQEEYANELYGELIPFLREKWTALREIKSERKVEFGGPIGI